MLMSSVGLLRPDIVLPTQGRTQLNSLESALQLRRPIEDRESRQGFSGCSPSPGCRLSSDRKKSWLEKVEQRTHSDYIADPYAVVPAPRTLTLLLPCVAILVWTFSHLCRLVLTSSTCGEQSVTCSFSFSPLDPNPHISSTRHS